MRYLISCLLVLCLALPAFAAGGYHGPGPDPGRGGGYHGPGDRHGVDTVREAKGARDDTNVVLTGHIVSRVRGSHDKYLFRDKTGEIVVDIDRRVFGGRDVDHRTLVRLFGEVDRDLLKPVKVDVKRLEILR